MNKIGDFVSDEIDKIGRLVERYEIKGYFTFCKVPFLAYCVVCGMEIVMKKRYITITGMKHYYGLNPFAIGKKIKCIKETNNPYDSEAIRAVVKGLGTVGYAANTPYTKATGTVGAGGIGDKVKKKFKVKVLFITSSKVICEVVDGYKEKKEKKIKMILTPPSLATDEMREG